MFTSGSMAHAVSTLGQGERGSKQAIRRHVRWYFFSQNTDPKIKLFWLEMAETMILTKTRIDDNDRDDGFKP